MSGRKGKTNMKLAVLDEINQIDRRLKKSKIRNDEEETSKLMSQRNKLREKLKTNRKLNKIRWQKLLNSNSTDMKE